MFHVSWQSNISDNNQCVALWWSVACWSIRKWWSDNLSESSCFSILPPWVWNQRKMAAVWLRSIACFLSCIARIHLKLSPSPYAFASAPTVYYSLPKMEETGAQLTWKHTDLPTFSSWKRKTCLISSSTTQSLRKFWPGREGESFTNACDAM